MCATDVQGRGRHLATSEGKQANQCELSAAMVHALCDSRVSAPLPKPLQQLSDSPRIGTRQAACFPSVAQLPAADIAPSSSFCIGLPGSHCAHAPSCLSEYLAGCVVVVCPLRPVPLNKFDSPARLAAVCTLPLAAPAGIERNKKSFRRSRDTPHQDTIPSRFGAVSPLRGLTSQFLF